MQEATVEGQEIRYVRIMNRKACAAEEPRP
jgi:hypothetical protein